MSSNTPQPGIDNAAKRDPGRRTSASRLLGTQIWLEQDASPGQVDELFKKAADCGYGWVRLFLMWPFIEPEEGVWNFDLFDSAFRAAAREGISIKATLTANSAPWHAGMPNVLHTHNSFLSEEHRERARIYIRVCVSRYAGHPALGQWILWNEPSEYGTRGPLALDFWRSWLADHYPSGIGTLNARWRTGYVDFADVPFPEDVPLPMHKNYHWNSFRPWLDDCQARSAWLVEQIRWIKEQVRAGDAVTPCCINPTVILANQAEAGTDLKSLGDTVEALGASFHPPFHFTFAQRQDFPALVASGVRHLRSLNGDRPVEVTEVQTGSASFSSMRPCDCSPGEIARFHLAALASGACSVTGWCFNTRKRDAEAGDWALLDNMDQPSPRSAMLRRVHDCLETLMPITGAWQPARTRAWVLIDPSSQAIEAKLSRMTFGPIPGLMPQDGAQGSAMLAVEMMRLGVATSIARIEDVEIEGDDVVICSQLLAWDESRASAVLDAVERGATLVFDAACGRLDLDGGLHRPWPGGWSERIGLRGAGLQSSHDGFAMEMLGKPVGRMVHARLVPVCTSSEWHAWEDLRFADGEPLVLKRKLGLGRLLVCRGLLGASLLHGNDAHSAISLLLRSAANHLEVAARPVGGGDGIISLPVQGEHGPVAIILAPDLQERQGRPLRLRINAQHCHDHWSGSACETDSYGEVTLPAPQGVAILTFHGTDKL